MDERQRQREMRESCQRQATVAAMPNKRERDELDQMRNSIAAMQVTVSLCVNSVCVY